jgi:hypothetical protein
MPRHARVGDCPALRPPVRALDLNQPPNLAENERQAILVHSQVPNPGWQTVYTESWQQKT